MVSKISTLTFIISTSQAPAKGARADRVCAALDGLPSRSQLKDWFLAGCLERGGKTLEPSTLIYPGDEIIVHSLAPRELSLEPRKLPLRIFFEDDDLIVLYKPKGLTMHPGASRRSETTLVHALLAHSANLSKGSHQNRPGIIHRLDKDTEGIVVVAKNNETHEAVASQFSARSIDRAYWALCWGKVPETLTIQSKIGRHPRNRKTMAVLHTGGKEALTHVKRLKFFAEGYSWVECRLETGRTHQIRVHLTHKGFPLLGDPVYGKSRKLIGSEKKSRAFEDLHGQALVAFRLGFTHPKTGERLQFESEKPEWLRSLLQE